MRLHAFFILPMICLALSSARADEQPSPTPKPGFFHRLLHPFEHSHATASATPAAEATSAPAKKPGLFYRMLHPFGGGETPENLQGKKVKDLALVMTLEPAQIKLPGVNEIKVRLRLENRGRHLVQLQFSTAQRVDAKITNKIGKVIAQWSEDQYFDNAPSFVTINPKERAEYLLTLPTRDLQAGELYDISGFILGYPDLQVVETISPAK